MCHAIPIKKLHHFQQEPSALLSVLIPCELTTKNNISKLPPLRFLVYHNLNRKIPMQLITHLTFGGSEFMMGIAERGLFP